LTHVSSEIRVSACLKEQSHDARVALKTSFADHGVTTLTRQEG